MNLEEAQLEAAYREHLCERLLYELLDRGRFESTVLEDVLRLKDALPIPRKASESEIRKMLVNCKSRTAKNIPSVIVVHLMKLAIRHSRGGSGDADFIVL